MDTLVVEKGSSELDDVRLFGAKAAGLHRLPDDWTLPYFALRVGAVATAARVELERAITAATNNLGPCPDGVLVRSSSIEEGLDERGALESQRCAADIAEIVATLERLQNSAPRDVRSRLGFVVQRWAPDAARGHLSNERRVSRDARSWLCEAELPVDVADRSFRFRVDSSVRPSAGLACNSFERLSPVLRTVARAIGRHGLRVHLEWVWDRERVWLVQRDEDVTPLGAPPGSMWIGPRSSQIELPLTAFVEAAYSRDERFPKVRHVATLRELGLPYGDVRVLFDADCIRTLANGLIPDALASDLDVLIAEPLVVRTDVRAPTGKPVLMSRRTDTCKTRSELDDFLISVAKELVEGGTSPDDVAFLAHRFLLADAGAFSLAEPGKARVRIDATWGLPDSLFFYPHDTYLVDVERHTTKRRIRCKVDYIDVDADGRWGPRGAGRPWDLRPALKDDVAIQIAASSLKLADHLGYEVETMFFVGTDADGRPWHLPWFFRQTEQRSSAPVAHARGFYVGDKVRITNGTDLAELELRLRDDPSRRPVITLRPEVRLLRDKPFVEQVAAVAARRGLTVDLEGSVLSHAYYMLDQAGVGVRVVDPHDDRVPRRAFGKLVRDLVPVRIRRHGELADVYHAGRDELLQLIRAKLLEEAFEHYWAVSPDTAVEELADVLEVVRTAAQLLGVEPDAVEAKAERKRRERGGFDAGTVLIETRGDTEFTTAGDSARLRLDESVVPRATGLPKRRPVRLPSRRILLPLVPPEGWEPGRAYVHPLDATDEVVLTYEGDEVLLEVRPRRQTPDERQMQLPM
jgi:predicted house-cleaning noncanonical NTP pyrophosphatase (MazG superfamily)